MPSIMSKPRRPRGCGLLRRCAAQLLVFALASLAALATPALAQSDCGSPCFEDTDDILGVQTVAPADDLVGLTGFTGFNGSIQTTPNYTSGLWETSGCDGTSCQVGALTTTPIVSNDCGLSWINSSNPDLDRYPIVFEAGRFFDLPNDVVANVSPSTSATGSPCGGADNLELEVIDPLDASHDSTVVFTQSAEFLQITKGDANLDGFEDLIFFTEGGIVAITATDPTDPTQGMTFGPVLTTASGPLSSLPVPVTQPSTGDLNADGLLDVAWVGAHSPGGSGNDQAFVATVCPGPVEGTICAGAQPLQIILGSTPIGLPKSSWAVFYEIPKPVSTAVVGNFDTALAGDELAVFFQSEADDIRLDMYTVLPGDASLVPQLAASQVSASHLGGFINSFQASAAPISFGTTPGDDLIYSLSWETLSSQNTGQTRIAVVVVTFDDGLQQPPLVTSSPVTVYSGGLFLPTDWFGGHAAGRFAGYDDSSSNFDLQIAVLSKTELQVWQMMGSGAGRSLQMAFSAAAGVTYDQPFVVNIQGAPLIRAADIQGRSLWLGAPDVVRIESHSQPTMIVKAPPTHVDHIVPSGGGDPVDLNVSAVGGYTSALSLTSSENQTASQQSTTSYSYATKETDTASGAVSYPTQKINASFGIGLGYQGAVTNTYSTTQSSTNASFTMSQMDISSSSSFDDVLWYESNAFNIYHYPVIGVVGCPDADSCDPSEEVPLYLVVSGPDTSFLNVGVPAHTVEWFQPIHEVGNLLSYPQTPELVEARLGDGAVPLTVTTDFAVSPGIATTESVLWQTGSGSGQTSGTVNTHSEEQQSSISTSVVGSAGEKVDKTQSTSWSTLNTSTTELDESTGIDIASPGTFAGPAGTYDYDVSPGIYGYTQPDGSAQEIELDVDVPSYGPLTVDYAIVPTGLWWTGDNDYTVYPDVALNHSERWTLDESDAGSSSDPNCLLQTNDNLSCAVFNQPATNETDPWMSSFLAMKGAFITTEADQGEGTLISSITDGEGAFLEVRLYNYSFVPLASGSETHVRFYAQEWCTTQACGGVNVPVPGVPSTLVEDVVVTQNPPPVDPTGAIDNWVTASSVFDTTDQAGKTFVFWVAVYALDGDGNIVGELPEHGITAVPGDSISMTQSSWLVQFVESYSNNVGLFHWPLAVQSEETAAAPEAAAIAVSEIDVSRRPDGRIETEVVLLSEKGVHRGTVLSLSVRGPVGPKQVVDLERTPLIGAGEEGGVRVAHGTPTCGRYKIWAESPRLASPATSQVDVPCDVHFRAVWLPPSGYGGHRCDDDFDRGKRHPAKYKHSNRHGSDTRCHDKGDRGGHRHAKHWKSRSHQDERHRFERVALLGSRKIPAEDILVGTLQAGPGAAAPVKADSRRRVNHDRRRDLVLTFSSEDLDLTPKDPELCITGSTVDGRRFATCLDRRIRHEHRRPPDAHRRARWTD